MNPEAPAFRPSISGPSAEDKKILELMSKISELTVSPHRKTPTTFPRFPELPPELRISIWEYAVTIPRIHLIGPYTRSQAASVKRNPGLRGVSHQAREEASKVQEPYSTWATTQGPTAVFVNPEVDTIFMQHMSYMFPNPYTAPNPPRSKGKIKRLAFSWYDWAEGMEHYTHTPDFLIEYPEKRRWCMELWDRGVEEIFLVLGDLGDEQKCFTQTAFAFADLRYFTYGSIGLLTPDVRERTERGLERGLNLAQRLVAQSLKPIIAVNKWSEVRGDCPDGCKEYCCNWKPIKIWMVDIVDSQTRGKVYPGSVSASYWDDPYPAARDVDI